MSALSQHRYSPAEYLKREETADYKSQFYQGEIFAMTGGKLLPKAGNWMNVVKTTFGFMLLSVAIIFVERLWNSIGSTPRS